MAAGAELRGVAICFLTALVHALTPAEEATLLLRVPTAWSNWEAALSSPACATAAPGAAWSANNLPCGAGGATWRGVICDTDGHVTGISLAFCGLKGSLPAELAQLESLQTLDLSHNALTGGIPADWRTVGAFPALQTLQLAHNSLAGALTDFTPVATGFIAGQYFNITHNAFNQSSIPAEWYAKNLQLLDLSFNNIQGNLPVDWGYPRELHEEEYPSAFPNLARLAIEGNNITGPFDPWPGGGHTVFSPDFLCTGRPGNAYMLIIPPPPALDSDSGDGLSAGAIAGIAVGCAAAVAVAAGLAFYVAKRRRGATTAGAGAGPSKAGGRKAGSGHGSDVEGGGSGWTGEGGKAGRSATASEAGAGSVGDSAFQADTDTCRLPAEWNTVPFSELELVSAVGQGSFGAVWLARWHQTAVAVKILGGDKVAGVSDSKHQRSIVRQLEKEAGLMSKLRHTNICLYMGAVLDPPCLIMEHCARKSVDEVLVRARTDPKLAKQLRWPRLLSMALDAAKGMLYLHTRSPPVFHRDLKPANLLVTSTWQVKVADFNLSRALEGTDFMSTICVQNPRWLAPEVLAGGEGGLPADVWAFGTVLWGLMTWCAPWEGANAYQIINTVQALPSGSGLEIPAASELAAGPLRQHAELAALIQACWQRDPVARPTFEEVTERLRAMLSAEVSSSATSSLSTPLCSGAISTVVPSPAATALPAGVPRQPERTALSGGSIGEAQSPGYSARGGSFEAATQAASQAFQQALSTGATSSGVSDPRGSTGGGGVEVVSPFASAAGPGPSAFATPDGSGRATPTRRE